MERLSTSLRSRDVDEYSSNEHSQLAGEPRAGWLLSRGWSSAPRFRPVDHEAAGPGSVSQDSQTATARSLRPPTPGHSSPAAISPDPHLLAEAAVYRTSLAFEAERPPDGA